MVPQSFLVFNIFCIAQNACLIFSCLPAAAFPELKHWHWRKKILYRICEIFTRKTLHIILCYFVYLLYFKHGFFLSELTEQIRSKMIKDPIMGWKCSDCDYRTKNNSVLYEHIESKHVDHPGYECDICSKFCSTRNSLRNHKSLKHRDREPKTRYIFQN